MQLGITLALLDPYIDRVGHLRDPLLDLFRDRPNDLEAGSLDLDVDRSLEAEVQHIADDTAGLKGDFDTGQRRLELLAKVRDVVFRVTLMSGH